MFMVMALPRPRSETKAAVTVTQQSATCAANNTSRSAQRVPRRIGFRLDRVIGIGLEYLSQWITPNTKPASTEISNPIRINDGCGCTTKNFIGYSLGGCQFARPAEGEPHQAAGERASED